MWKPRSDWKLPGEFWAADTDAALGSTGSVSSPVVDRAAEKLHGNVAATKTPAEADALETPLPIHTHREALRSDGGGGSDADFEVVQATQHPSFRIGVGDLECRIVVYKIWG